MKTYIFQSLRVLAVLIWTVSTHEGLANQATEHSFESRTADAEVVIIGRILDLTDESCPAGYKCARVETLQLFKGTADEILRVTVHTPISESNRERCCEVGSIYLYFLRRTPIDATLFYPVNEPFGFYLLEGPVGPSGQPGGVGCLRSKRIAPLLGRYTYGNNNPYRYRDPDGKVGIDILFVAYDVYELAHEGATAVNVISLGLDIASTAGFGFGAGEIYRAGHLAEEAVHAG